MGEVASKKQVNIHQLFMKLERNHSLLKKFLVKLNSYTCEPTDYNCFIQVGKLKEELKDLIAEQEKLFGRLRQKVSLKKSYLERMDMFNKRFEKLEQGMAEYLLSTNKYNH